MFKENKPKLIPKINQTTDPGGQSTPALTLFNILCMDYLEEVDGNYVLSQMFNFAGPLLDQLNRQSNDVTNELFFDLRVAPDFKVREKDGLGKDLDGALPMVPAVVLREKPFTIYKDPQSQLREPDKTNIITTGGAEDRFGSLAKDQLFVKLSHNSGYSKIEANESNLDAVNDIIESSGFEITNPPKIVSTETKIEENKNDNKKSAIPKSSNGANNSSGKITYDDTKTWESNQSKPNVIETSDLAITNYVEQNVSLAEQSYALMYSLPRPVFKSPDGGRVTMELRVASQDAILGVLDRDQSGTGKQQYKFMPLAVSEDNNSSNTISAEKTLLSSFTSVYSSNLNTSTGLKTAWQYHTTDSSKVAKFIKSDILKNQQLRQTKTRYHVLDKMTVLKEDIISEGYYRSDGEVYNITELHGDLSPDFEFQKAIASDKLPITTAISIQRGGVRVQSFISSFLQQLITGGGSNAWLAGLAYRWCVLLDMWTQHNHELLTGNLTLRGMPGIRVGYKIDRPDLGLSFYVDSVGHEWTYPGNMITNISVSRGQPTQDENRVLDYIPHEPRVHSNRAQRQKLGTQFPVHNNITIGKDNKRSKVPVQQIIPQPVSTIDLDDDIKRNK